MTSTSGTAARQGTSDEARALILERLDRARTVGVAGFGREGQSFLRHCRALGGDRRFIVFDDRPVGDDERAAFDDLTIDWAPSSTAAAWRDRLDAVFRSPGLSIRTHPLMAALRGVPVLTSVNLWLARYAAARTIAITGTKGKSTTAALLAHVLAALGQRCVLGGNIGVPLFDIEPGDDWSVLELSSYQIADMAIAPDVAVMLNLYPEHIDWHGSRERYYADKARLVMALMPPVAVVNGSDPRLASVIPRDRVTHGFNDPAGYHVRDSAIYLGEERIDLVPRLRGDHNLVNICAVLTVLRAIGLGDEHGRPSRAVTESINVFSGLAHRLQELGVRESRLYVNDSISTTPESALAALSVYAGRPVTLLLGGHDREQDYGGLIEGAAKHGRVRLLMMPDNGSRIVEACKAAQRAGVSVPYALCASLEDAVVQARNLTPEGGVILLSPGAPSYGRFRNFEERGARFAACSGFGSTEIKGNP